ncbi:MAG: nucleoid-associated protein, partial [Bacteroidales bacterium]
MIFYDNTFLESLAIHKVGNHIDEEGIRLSESLVEVEADIKALLLQYFFTPFKNPEYYHFVHENDVHLNEVYRYASKIFEKPTDLYEQSKNLAKYLYEESANPKVKSGDFFTVYFKDVVVEGEHLDAIGLFKSEAKETFLTLYPNAYNYDIEREEGLNLCKLDKGCLIFNKEKEEGYLVAVVDTKKGADAQFWFDQFLHVEQRQDTYFQTKNTL